MTIRIIFLLVIVSSSSQADTIYKSVDESGNVTYSTTPPKESVNSRPVDIAPPPSEERIKAAQQRQERNREAAQIIDEDRKKREQITAEENRLKRERQKQLQLQQQAEENNTKRDYGYPYYPGHRPRRPIIIPPVAVPYQ